MNSVVRDMRYAIRILTQGKGLTLVALVSLALGIGANSAIFSVVNAILLNPLPYSDPDRLVLVWGDVPAEGIHRSQCSATDVEDWGNQNSVFEDITTFGGWSATLLGVGEPERLQGTQVGDRFFEMMRAKPLLGRTFLPEEQQEGKDTVVILGYGLWREKFGGNPEIIGTQINLASNPYTVVGVMPADFAPLPKSLVDPQGQFYRPVAEPYDDTLRSGRHLRCIARLKPGVTLERAQADMSRIAANLEQLHPTANTGYGVRLVTLPEDTVGTLRPMVLAIFGAVTFVLLIACANVANLLLARSVSRQREVAVRLALGATRRRLVRQFLTESVILSAAGGGLGILLASWGIDVAESVGSKVSPLLAKIPLDSRVLAFSLGITLITSLVFGLAPALQLSRTDLTQSLKEESRGSSTGAAGNRLRRALVVSELAMALVLMVCATLMIKSVIRLRKVDPGFSSANLLTMDLPLPLKRYPKGRDQAEFYNRLETEIGARAGIQGVGLTSILPFGSNFDGRSLAIEDHPVRRGEEISVDLYIVTTGYLATMAIPVLEGRGFSDRDIDKTEPVTLINNVMAQRYWPSESPIGKRIKFPGSERFPQPWRTIIGVVGDVRQYGLDREPRMQMYLPESQYPTSSMSVVVRTSGEPAAVTSPVREEIHLQDKDLAVYGLATMDELMSESIALRRFSMLLLVTFAALAMLLAIIGIYGVTSYTVRQRTREMGIRMALGAMQRDIVVLVLRQGLKVSAIGIGSGVVGSFAMSRALESQLFGVSATDPVTFVGISVLLCFVALIACLIPARRAARTDPMTALREE